MDLYLLFLLLMPFALFHLNDCLCYKCFSLEERSIPSHAAETARAGPAVIDHEREEQLRAAERLNAVLGAELQAEKRRKHYGLVALRNIWPENLRLRAQLDSQLAENAAQLDSHLAEKAAQVDRHAAEEAAQLDSHAAEKAALLRQRDAAEQTVARLRARIRALEAENDLQSGIKTAAPAAPTAAVETDRALGLFAERNLTSRAKEKQASPQAALRGLVRNPQRHRLDRLANTTASRVEKVKKRPWLDRMARSAVKPEAERFGAVSTETERGESAAVAVEAPAAETVVEMGTERAWPGELAEAAAQPPEETFGAVSAETEKEEGIAVAAEAPAEQMMMERKTESAQPGELAEPAAEEGEGMEGLVSTEATTEESVVAAVEEPVEMMEVERESEMTSFTLAEWEPAAIEPVTRAPFLFAPFLGAAAQDDVEMSVFVDGDTEMSELPVDGVDSSLSSPLPVVPSNFDVDVNVDGDLDVAVGGIDAEDVDMESGDDDEDPAGDLEKMLARSDDLDTPMTDAETSWPDLLIDEDETMGTDALLPPPPPSPFGLLRPGAPALPGLGMLHQIQAPPQPQPQPQAGPFVFPPAPPPPQPRNPPRAPPPSPGGLRMVPASAPPAQQRQEQSQMPRRAPPAGPSSLRIQFPSAGDDQQRQQHQPQPQPQGQNPRRVVSPPIRMAGFGATQTQPPPEGRDAPRAAPTPPGGINMVFGAPQAQPQPAGRDPPRAAPTPPSGISMLYPGTNAAVRPLQGASTPVFQPPPRQSEAEMRAAATAKRAQTSAMAQASSTAVAAFDSKYFERHEAGSSGNTEAGGLFDEVEEAWQSRDMGVQMRDRDAKMAQEEEAKKKAAAEQQQRQQEAARAAERRRRGAGAGRGMGRGRV